MAKIIYQPWVNERLRDLEKLEAMDAQFTFLMQEMGRRYLATEGEDACRTMLSSAAMDGERDVDWTEAIALLQAMNEGKEPAPIKDVRLSKSDRDYLRALGQGSSKTEVKRLRLILERDLIFAEVEELAPKLGEERQRRDPGYPPMRRRQFEAMIEKLDEAEKGVAQDKDEPTQAYFLRSALFSPPGNYGIEVNGGSKSGTFVLDPARDLIHRYDRRGQVELELDGFISDSCGQFIDIQQNFNLRLLTMVFMACPSGEDPKPCGECIPEGLGDHKLENLLKPITTQEVEERLERQDA